MRTFIGSPLRAANCSPGRPRPGGRYAPWPVTSDPSSSSLESLGLLTVRFLAATHRLPPDHLAAMAATVAETPPIVTLIGFTVLDSGPPNGAGVPDIPDFLRRRPVP